MEMPEVLEKIGLSKKQAGVYLGLLELGAASVQSIALKAGIKRPTTYLILSELKQKGFVSTVPRAKKVLFQAESPEILLTDLNHREDLIKRFMPSMLAVFNAKKEKPQVQLFEGKEGVKIVYDKILMAKEVKFFATIRDFMNFYPEFADKLKQKAKQRSIKVQEILTQDKSDLIYAKTVEHDEYYQQRFIPKGKSFFTDNVIFEDNVIFFSYTPHIFAVMITSRGISQSLKTLFEMAWQQAESLQKT